MNSYNSTEKEFLNKLTEIIETNLINPRFGVSALARELGMSRSSLHRKVNELTKNTVSQFIIHTRLKHAMELLKHTSFTVSEITYKVGFNNVSYFIKRFHEYYGYSPGKVGNREENENDVTTQNKIKKRSFTTIVVPVIFVLFVAVIVIVVFKPFYGKQKKPDKTIAVLRPEINGNDPDSYLIESIMEEINVKLGLIKELEVIPWTSGRKYKNATLSVREISKELKVKYIVESTGYILDNKIHLSVTLVDAPNHETIETYSYTRPFEDIFALQDEISEEVSEAIDATITPEEQKKINKKPTENEIAYANYMKAKRKRENDVEAAIPLFQKALEYDNEFALVYAELAITYYMLNAADSAKRYSKVIGKYADLAMSYDNQHDICLIAKAYDYLNKEEEEIAESYLNRALEYNPNSLIAMKELRSIYRGPGWGQYISNHEKILEYSLRPIKSKLLLSDSTFLAGIIFDYGRVASAFRATGFFEEALFYTNKQLEINPNNNGAINQKSQILADMNEYQQSIQLLLDFIQRDSPNFETWHFLATSYFLNRDLENAYKYYMKSIELWENYKNPRIAYFLIQQGDMKNATELINKMIADKKTSPTSPQNDSFDLSRLYFLQVDTAKAFEQMRIFSKQSEYPYWRIRVYKDSPIFDDYRDLPEFKELLADIETKFWNNHERIKASMKQKGLM